MRSMSLQDVCFGSKNQGLSPEECEKRAREALRLVDLKEKYFDHSPFDLSGGQKRRATIAGVLAMRPKVLVLDEPTAGLDPKGRDEILDQIAYLHEKADMTVILVSHSMEDIAKYVDRIIVMNKGDVMFNDVPKKVFAHYKELESVGLASTTGNVHHACAEGKGNGCSDRCNKSGGGAGGIKITEEGEGRPNDSRHNDWTILSG